MKRFFALLMCFVLVISLAVPASALLLNDIPSIPSPYSVYTEEFQERFPYAFVEYYSSGISKVFYLYACASEPFVTHEENGHTYINIPEVDGGLSYLRWTFSSLGDDWNSYAGYSPGLKLLVPSDLYHVFSSFDVFSSDGSLYSQADFDFFMKPPVPLEVEILEVTQAALPNLTQETVRTASILVVCGIGCLALLMGLVLLAKKFKIFLR